MSAPVALAQSSPDGESLTIRGDRLTGVVLPILPITADTSIHALNASLWVVDDTQRLLLSGDVAISIGPYNFRCKQALLWLNRIPSNEGLINQLAVFADDLSDPTRQAGLGIDGSRVLITASARGDVSLDVALLQRLRPSTTSFIRDGENRLLRYFQAVVHGSPDLHRVPVRTSADEPDREFTPTPGGAVSEDNIPKPVQVERPPTTTDSPWLATPDSTIRYSADLIDIQPGESEDIATITGHIVLQISNPRSDDPLSSLTLMAERAVIFARPGAFRATQQGAITGNQLSGIYLEGNVTATAQDERYSVRAPQMYYDYATNRAIMSQSILRLQGRPNQPPIYSRAQEMRQTAKNQWDAREVRVSTSEFYTPHLSVGADRLFVSQQPAQDDASAPLTRYSAHGVTMQAGDLPFFYWPTVTGDGREPPLKSLEVGTRRNDGLQLLSTWDPFVLTGIKRPDGVSADLKLDGFTDRGTAAGLNFKYDLADSVGQVDLYGFLDHGTDRTTSGREVDPEREFRGLALLEDTTRLSRYWSLQTQLSLVSDPTFVSARRQTDFVDRREYESSVFLKYQNDRAALSLLAKHNFNEFLSNDYLLASRQYSVDRFPELAYRRYGDALFDGRVTYSGESRLSRLRFAFERRTPAEIGVRGRAFGLDEDDRISEALRAQGLSPSYVTRFDTRHELTMPLEYGPLGVTPFIVGRFTGYDDDFDQFSSDADALRVFGAAGVRLTTQVQRVYNNVHNRLFGLHRLRHIIQPHATLWHGFASVSQEDLPEYDAAVESLAAGSAVKLGVTNIFQTQRGGPGRWYSVDVLKWDNYFVFSSEDAERESPTAQFFDYRPEYSQFGDHFHSAFTWQISDSLALAGDATFDLEDSLIARGAIGLELRHSPSFSTYVEYRVIEISDNELLAIGWNYQIASKYILSLSPEYDFREDDFRSVTARLTRRFPDVDFTLRLKYDRIQDETSMSATMQFVSF